jgi:ubiquinol-cytochrome c reductase cytochrome b subunit
MAVTFYLVLVLSGGNDVIADKFNISLNATTWAGRIGILTLPPLMFFITQRICLGLQQHDREVLAHGVETGIIKRLPDGKFIEVHQPLADPDEHGHVELDYTGWVVPKKMNRVGALTPTRRGFFRDLEARDAKKLGSSNGANGHSQNGHADSSTSDRELTSGPRQ